MTLNLKDIIEKGVCITCLSYGNNLMPLSVKEHIFKYLNCDLISELTEVMLCRYCYSNVKHLSHFCQLAQECFETLSAFLKQVDINSPDSKKSILLKIEKTDSPFLLQDEEQANTKKIGNTSKLLLCLIPKADQRYDLSIEKDYNSSRSDKVERTNSYSETYFSDSDDLLLSDLQQFLKKDIKVKHSEKDLEVHKNKENTNNQDARKESKNILAQKFYVDEITMLRQRQSARSSKWFIMAQYKCEDCIIGYYSEKLLNNHNLLKHNIQNKHICNICKVRCRDKIALAKHVTLHYLRLGCTACNQNYRYRRDLEKHYATVHGTILYKCHQCPDVFTTQPSLVYHRMCEHRDKPHCEQCHKQFRNKTTCKRHMLLHTGMPTFTCKVCNKTYRGKFGYLTHVKTHGPPSEEAYCSLCNVQFKNACQYRRHCKISQRHLAKKCDTTCGYECVDCKKIFAASNVLKQHRESVHLKLKKHHCTVCGKNYASPASLWTHNKVHHEKKEIPKDKVCEKCGKGFKTNASLMAHLRVHSTEKAFACATCDASFKHNSGLYMHKRLVHRRPPDKGALQHAPIRTDLPIKCKLCPATFQHSSGVYIHTRLVHKNGAKNSD